MKTTSRGKPRIGLLTYGLDRPLSGVTRAALELGLALHDSQDCEVVFLAPYGRGPFRNDNGFASFYLPGCSRLPGLMLLGGTAISFAARRLRLDLVHDPVGICPFVPGLWPGTYKRIVTLYDAIAFRYPQGYPWLNNLLHRRYIPAALGQVDAVVTCSMHSKQDLMQFLKIPADGVHVVPLGVHSRFRPLSPQVAEPITRRYGLVGPFVLSVGAQQKRKNVGRLLEAFAELHAELPEYRLAIVGPTLWKHDGLHEQIEMLGLQRAVAILGYVPDEDLCALYSMSSLFVFPSLYEGFGLPVLEAMASGTPVICSNATSLPDVAGDAALLFDPTDTRGLAEAMRQVLNRPELRLILRRKGLERAREFSWESVARATMGIYRQVLGE